MCSVNKSREKCSRTPLLHRLLCNVDADGTDVESDSIVAVVSLVTREEMIRRLSCLMSVLLCVSGSESLDYCCSYCYSCYYCCCY